MTRTATRHSGRTSTCVAAICVGALGLGLTASLAACNTSDYKRSKVEGAAAQQQLRTEKAREAYERQQIQPYQK